MGIIFTILQIIGRNTWTHEHMLTRFRREFFIKMLPVAVKGGGGDRPFATPLLLPSGCLEGGKHPQEILSK